MNRSFPSLAALVWCTVFALVAALPASAAKARKDPATVILAADLRESKNASSPVLATLAAGEQVSVLGLQGAHAQVEAAGKVGWMASSKLRLGTGQAAASGESSGGTSSWLRGLTGMLGGGGSSGGDGSKVPIGIRGLQKGDLASAQPDPAAVDRMESFKATADQGLAHAGAAGLQSYPLDYRESVAAPAATGGSGARASGADN